MDAEATPEEEEEEESCLEKDKFWLYENEWMNEPQGSGESYESLCISKRGFFVQLSPLSNRQKIKNDKMAVLACLVRAIITHQTLIRHALNTLLYIYIYIDHLLQY